MSEQVLTSLIEAINASERIVLIMHVSPDGDTCGSAFALRRALLTREKSVELVCDHPVPRIYLDLDGAQAVKTPDMLEGIHFDLSIAVDIADVLRMGESARVFHSGKNTAQIDHHGTNPHYAQINYVRYPLSATAVLVMEVIDALGVPLEQDMASALLVGVTTDTGNFKQQNTDCEALQLAARCIETGIDPSEVARRVFDIRPYAQVKLLARALESLVAYDDGQIVIMYLSGRDFEETGALPEHTEGIVNFGINTEGAQIAALLTEPGDKVRCSMRCLPPYDVSVVATAFGGGGHPLAAGCTLDVPLEEALKMVEAEMRKELGRHS